MYEQFRYVFSLMYSYAGHLYSGSVWNQGQTTYLKVEPVKLIHNASWSLMASILFLNVAHNDSYIGGFRLLLGIEPF